MKRSVMVVLSRSLAIGGVLALAIPAVQAQQGGASGAPALNDQGQQLYDANCVACHQASGAGSPPTQPALTGNDRLSDVDHVVRTIRLGKGGMPTFPQLAPAEIAAVATYVRNAWGNKFGAVTAGQVTTILAALPKSDGAKVSVWSGVYSDAQNKRGQVLQSGACAHCHGPRLNGAAQSDQPPSPAIARVGFLRKWEGQSVAALFVYICTKMPPDAPGTLNDQQCADAIAHMFAMSNMPAGDKELPADPKALENFVIETEAKK
jgi:mono/diheme cytochrome c family protein